jgi:hypothetical protein
VRTIALPQSAYGVLYQARLPAHMKLVRRGNASNNASHPDDLLKK